MITIKISGVYVGGRSSLVKTPAKYIQRRNPLDWEQKRWEGPVWVRDLSLSTGGASVRHVVIGLL